MWRGRIRSLPVRRARPGSLPRGARATKPCGAHIAIRQPKPAPRPFWTSSVAAVFRKSRALRTGRAFVPSLVIDESIVRTNMSALCWELHPVQRRRRPLECDESPRRKKTRRKPQKRLAKQAQTVERLEKSRIFSPPPSSCDVKFRTQPPVERVTPCPRHLDG
ncbi:hypothetical protein F5144DRAFT_346622 [Chaetomium tenue]|uniref:Uncharacterized protein n=1 Tax=Chaetomium tenue TaxID=1854479 RepID=A0ACB7P0X1_9PEZI|nr:hypothetical protein F5144DRAFT_346622 [Chaetomium globosum]